ncbi:MAG: 3-hydroxyacyl-CoA dehydrogenase NAD-binding domain-containing protein, partial [Deferrisomatales bacterium]
MEIKKVGVLGAGTMGHGIAQVFAVGGYPVVLRDIS